MKRALLAPLSLIVISPLVQPPIALSLDLPAVTIADFNRQPPIGNLGHPLGKITTISGVVRQAPLDAKSTDLDLVLSVEAVNDRLLPQPVTIPFKIFDTAQVAAPVLGRSFRYIGYETGGFTGVPAAAFQFVPAVATTEHQFTTIYQVLREELDRVKTQADLVKFNDRRVQVIGKYIAHSRKPAIGNTGIIDFQGVYTTANIELADGTLVPLFPPDNKQSLRSAAEVQAYAGKTVSVVGKIEIKIDSRRSNAEPRSMLTTMDGIWLERSR
jgi:hypothetical protein